MDENRTHSCGDVGDPLWGAHHRPSLVGSDRVEEEYRLLRSLKRRGLLSYKPTPYGTWTPRPTTQMTLGGRVSRENPAYLIRYIREMEARKARDISLGPKDPSHND